jgi:hypothetical protein
VPPNETCVFEEKLLAEAALDVVRRHDVREPRLGLAVRGLD